jgi:hypothetical protein
MLSFETKGPPYVHARGVLYFVENDRARHCDTGWADIVGQDVLIDGVARRVIGVERNMVLIVPKGSPIGLLVAHTEVKPPCGGDGPT